jgi:hypothetical protein
MPTSEGQSSRAMAEESIEEQHGASHPWQFGYLAEGLSDLPQEPDLFPSEFP